MASWLRETECLPWPDQRSSEEFFWPLSKASVFFSHASPPTSSKLPRHPQKTPPLSTMRPAVMDLIFGISRTTTTNNECRRSGRNREDSCKERRRKRSTTTYSSNCDHADFPKATIITGNRSRGEEEGSATAEESVFVQDLTCTLLVIVANFPYDRDHLIDCKLDRRGLPSTCLCTRNKIKIAVTIRILRLISSTD